MTSPIESRLVSSRSSRPMLSAFTLTAVLLTFSGLACAQAQAYNSQNTQSSPKAEAQMSDAHGSTDKTTPKSDAEKSFDEMKTLAGHWQGHVTMDPPMGDVKDAAIQVSLRVASRGNAIVHEMQEANTPEDPSRYDHPITMFYVDNDRLLLTHYCDAGNRPRMTGKLASDGKQIKFNFLDVAGSTQRGHMQDAVFTTVNADHHIEDWYYLMPGDKLMHARMELTRTK